MRTFGTSARLLPAAGGLLAAVACLAPAGSAHAQFYLQTETSTAFVPLAAIPGITGRTDFAFSSADEGTATLQLPFAFRYLGTPYTDLEIKVNGQLGFGGGYIGGYVNRGIGDTSGPNNIIAVWWDDLILPDPAGHASYGVLGVAPNRIFIIEVRDWEHYGLSNINDGRYQVWLYEGALGRFEVHYDRLLTDTENYSATAGWQGDLDNGGPSGAFRPCAVASPYCDHVDYAGMAGIKFRVEQAQGPELLGSVGDSARGALPGQSVNVPVSIRNVGTDDAANVTSELYLSADPSLDPATDTRIAVFVAPSVTAAGGTVDLTVPATVPAGVAPGDYYLLLSVDAPNSIAEPSEQNNVAQAANLFATAHQFTALTIDVPAGAAPGQSLQVDLTVANTGVPYVGNLAVGLTASIDRTFDASDFDLGPFVIPLSGALQEQVSLTVPLPVTLPPGGYFAIVTLDPGNILPQIDPIVDRLSAQDAFPTAPDLVPTQVLAPAGATPGAALDLQVTLTNQGLDWTGPVSMRFMASTDPIYDLNDTPLGNSSVNLSLAAGQSQTVPVTLTVPALRAGNYYAIALVDPARVIPEVSDFNNTRVSANTFATGPDLSILNVDGPNEAAPGSLVDFVVSIGSIGAAYAGNTNYALFLSEDEVFDSGDIFMGGTSVSIGGLTEVTDTLTLPFPAVPPGEYYTIAQVDPSEQIVEADEGNNIFIDPDEIESGPDFRVFSAAISPSTGVPGDTITVDFTFFNNGTAYTGPVQYRGYLSVDSQLDPQDLFVMEGVIALAGETSSFTVTSTFALAAGVPPADYRVIVEVDPADLIPEVDETNNDDDSSTRLEVLGSNPVVAAISAGPVAFTGEPYVVHIDVLNQGALDANGLEVEVYLSGVGVLLEGTPLGRVGPLTLPAGVRRTLTATVTIPAASPPGLYLLGTVVDPDGVLAEESERDNLFLRPGGLTVMAPAADLEASIVQTTTVAAPGEPLAITRTVRNLGVADALTIGLSYVLSDDAIIGADDLVVGTASAAVVQGGAELAIDVVDLPHDVQPGAYWLGLIVDPEQRVPEVDETNNTALGPQIVVYEPGLRILNSVLPLASVGIEYEVALYARGGTQALGWSLVQGSLPAGVVLDQVTGMLRGTPRDEGRYVFTVQVRSGGPVARAQLELIVRSASVPLSLASTNVNAGTVGRDYSAQLLAVGGLAPYRFTALHALPQGLQLSPDGLISGTPELSGTTTVRIRVDDSAGASDAKEYVFRVLSPDHRLLIVQAPLPLARVGTEYCTPEPVTLSASGGSAPYRWALLGEIPEGMALSEAGDLCGVPTRAGAHTLMVRATDAGGIIDTSQFVFEVVAADDFVVRTVNLDDASVGQAYSAQLEVLGASGAVV